jgi:endoglycosylceramidase
VVHLNTIDCTTGTDLGPTEPFLALLGRGYPRAAPGRIERLESDPESGRLLLEAEAERAGETLVLWTPTEASTHSAWAEGLGDLTEHPLPGGRLITGTVAARGAYTVGVDAP